MKRIVKSVLALSLCMSGTLWALAPTAFAQSSERTDSSTKPAWRPANQVSKPSFNSARARSVAERRICAVPAFGAQDRAIAALYGRLVGKTPMGLRAALAADQAGFNRAREDCYTQEQAQDDCLGGLLEARVWQLNNWIRAGYR
jgi:uncharacterized protein